MLSARLTLATCQVPRARLARCAAERLRFASHQSRDFVSMIAKGGAGVAAALGLAYVAIEAVQRFDAFQLRSIRRAIYKPQPELRSFLPGRLFLQRPDKLSFLAEVFGSDPSGPILLTGPAGSGKSAALKQVLRARFQTVFLDLRATPVASGEALALAFVEQAGFLMPPRELLGRAVFASSATSSATAQYELEKAFRLIREVLRADKAAGLKGWLSPGPDGRAVVTPPLLVIDELNLRDVTGLADDAAFWRFIDWSLFVTDNRLANVCISCSTEVADMLDAHPGFRSRRHRVFFNHPRPASVALYFHGVVNPFLREYCDAVPRPGGLLSQAAANAPKSLGKAATHASGEGVVEAAPTTWGHWLARLWAGRPSVQVSPEPSSASSSDLPMPADLAKSAAADSTPAPEVTAPATAAAVVARLDGEGPSAVVAFARAAHLAAADLGTPPKAGQATLDSPPSLPQSPADNIPPPAQQQAASLASPKPIPSAAHNSYFSYGSRFEFAPWGRTQRRFYLLEDAEIETIVGVIGGHLKDVHTVVAALLAGKHWTSAIERLVADSADQVEGTLDVLLARADGAAAPSGSTSGAGTPSPADAASAGNSARSPGARRGLRLRLLARGSSLPPHDYALFPERHRLASYARFLRAWALLSSLESRKYVQRRELADTIFRGCSHELDFLVDAGLASVVNVKGLSLVNEVSGATASGMPAVPGLYISSATPRMRVAFRSIVRDPLLQRYVSRLRAAIRVATLREEEVRLQKQRLPDAFAERAYWHAQVQALLVRDTALRSAVARELMLLQAAAPVSAVDFLRTSSLVPAALESTGEAGAASSSSQSMSPTAASSPQRLTAKTTDATLGAPARPSDQALLGVRSLETQLETSLANLRASEAEVHLLRRRIGEIRSELAIAETEARTLLEASPDSGEAAKAGSVAEKDYDRAVEWALDNGGLIPLSSGKRASDQAGATDVSRDTATDAPAYRPLQPQGSAFEFSGSQSPFLYGGSSGASDDADDGHADDTGGTKASNLDGTASFDRVEGESPTPSKPFSPRLPTSPKLGRRSDLVVGRGGPGLRSPIGDSVAERKHRHSAWLGSDHSDSGS